MKRQVAMLPLALLFGCAVQKPLPPKTVTLTKTVEVKVVVPAPCLTESEVPQRPLMLTDDEILSIGSGEAVVSALRLRDIQKGAWAELLNAALIACTKPPEQPPKPPEPKDKK